MAKLITKFKYLKPSAKQIVGGYAKYIATREGVEKVDDTFKNDLSTEKQKKLIGKILRDFPDSRSMLEYEDYLKEPTLGNASEFITRAVEDNAHEALNTKTYADYIATRPRAERFGSHGLFTDDGVRVKLEDISKELNEYDGNVWTVIISLRREDAERLGFNSGERWRDMLRTQTETIAKNFKIPVEDLKWYAAFHNESHHPHVHLMVYASEQAKPYLTQKGIMNLRSAFAKDVFADDLLSVYEKQTEHRNALRAQSRDVIAKIVSRINSGTYDNPLIENKLLELAERLSKTDGKKQYGYLKAALKAIVNKIVSELASDERIASLYDLWYEQREEVIRTYTEELPERIPLVDNPEFKSIKNMVIQEALNITADRMPVEEIDDAVLETDADTDSDPDPNGEEPIEMDAANSAFAHDQQKTWWTHGYKTARQFLYGAKETPPDLEKAFAMMQSEAESGNGFAMHDLGKMLLSGLGCEANELLSGEWFSRAYHAFVAAESASKKPDYLQYRIGKMHSFGYGVEQSYEKAAEWYEKAVAAGNPFAAYSLGALCHRGQGVDRDERRAFALYTMAAEDTKKPNAYAAYELGRMCKAGIGVEADERASQAWYARAYTGFLEIERSMADDKLYYRLGQMNLTGTGTRSDLHKARSYFEKAAVLENADALYGLGKLFLKQELPEYDPQKAVEYLIQTAQKGHEFAQYTLGKLFLKGDEVAKNTDYALRWLEEAAKKENPYAEYLLGKTFLCGDDVERDIEKAEKFLRRSVDQGNQYAAYLLGKTLLDGELLLQDIPEAIRLLTDSADKGFAAGQYLMGKLLYRGELIPQDVVRAIDYLERAVAQKSPYAAYLAGKIRLTEAEVQDVQRAIRNFEIAAENGNDYAEYQLGKLYLFGKEVERDEETALAYLHAAAEHGNPYAAQLLHSIQSNRQWYLAMGVIRLLHHMSRMIQDKLGDEKKGTAGATDRKLKRKIDEKKQAHGLKQG